MASTARNQGFSVVTVAKEEIFRLSIQQICLVYNCFTLFWIKKMLCSMYLLAGT